MTNKKITEDQVDNALQLIRSVAAGRGDRNQIQKIVSTFRELGPQINRITQGSPQTTQPGQTVNSAPASGRRNIPQHDPSAHNNRMNAVILQQGDSGQEVRDLQTKLNRFLRNSPLTVDGEYGPTTAQAVRTYQQSRIGQQDGLEATGNLDGRTNASLINRLDILDGTTPPDRTNRGRSDGPRTTSTQPGNSMSRNINRITSPAQGGRSRSGAGPKNIATLNQSVDFSTRKSVKEGLGELADMAERDHEVQMARSDLYKIAKYAIKLHDMLKQVSEAEGIEGWQQAKITKAADYIGSVYHALDYDMKFEQPMVPESVKPKRHKPVLSNEDFKSYKGSLAEKLQNKTHTCPDCGKASWTTLGMTEEQIVEGERHGNSKIYDKCWKGFKKVPGKKRGEPGSCERA